MIQIGRRWCCLTAAVPRVGSLVRSLPFFSNTAPMLLMSVYPGTPLLGVASLVELPTVQPSGLDEVLKATTNSLPIIGSTPCHSPAQPHIPSVQLCVSIELLEAQRRDCSA